MKKILAIMMTGMLLLGLTACGSTTNTTPETADPPSAGQTAAPEGSTGTDQEDHNGSDTLEPEAADKNAVVVYFSATGNTKAAAETLAKMQGADLYEIVPEQPYTAEDLNYNDRSTRATVEQNDENARPAIAGSVDNIEAYDVIYVGFPIWWGDMPRILYTFLDSYDLSGKTIAPFATSGGQQYFQSCAVHRGSGTRSCSDRGAFDQLVQR